MSREKLVNEIEAKRKEIGCSIEDVEVASNRVAELSQRIASSIEWNQATSSDIESIIEDMRQATQHLSEVINDLDSINDDLSILESDLVDGDEEAECEEVA